MTHWPSAAAAVGAAAGVALALRPVARRIAATNSRWLAGTVVMVLGVVAGLVAWLSADSIPELVTYALFGGLCAVLTAVDLAVERLPDLLVGTAVVILVVGYGVSAALAGDPFRWGRALLGGLVLLAAYFVLALISPRQLGLGDVKLAGALGIYLGWSGWRTVLYGSLFGFLLSAVVGLTLLATRRGTLTSQYPFGPMMITGAMAAVVLL